MLRSLRDRSDEGAGGVGGGGGAWQCVMARLTGIAIVGELASTWLDRLNSSSVEQCADVSRVRMRV